MKFESTLRDYIDSLIDEEADPSGRPISQIEADIKNAIIHCHVYGLDIDSEEVQQIINDYSIEF